MARLKAELLERFEAYADRVADVGEELDRQGRFRRVVEQVVACGTSVGANAFEADEALSSADFLQGPGNCAQGTCGDEILGAIHRASRLDQGSTPRGRGR